jgi:hypothetical protein
MARAAAVHHDPASRSIAEEGGHAELVNDVREAVVRAYPRGAFDRRFLDAIGREAALRRDCQCARLLNETGLAAWMARSPWRTTQ